MRPLAALLLVALLAVAASPVAAANSGGTALTNRSGSGSAGGTVSDAGPAAAESTAKCEYKWKKKRIVKKVRRHGKLVKIVKFRHYRICIPVPAPVPERLGVKAFEYGLTLSAASTTAGDTIVELSNRGEDAHDLHIQRSDDTTGATEVAVAETSPSAYTRVRFNTQPGTYRLWCSLPTHAALGMDATLTVTADKSPTAG